jgi:DNA-binding NarL/FixJ family response regulator
LCVAAQLELRRGHFELGRAHADEAYELAVGTGQTVLSVLALAALADIDASVGDRDACAERTELMLKISARAGITPTPLIARAQGRAALVAGDAEAAYQALARVEANEVRLDTRDPRILQTVIDVIEAAAWTGRRAEAEAAFARLDRAEREVGGDWTAGAAARARGILGGDDDLDRHFQTSATAFRRAESPYDVARSLLLWGERLRRARRRAESRAPLREALALFERLGAKPLATRARGELEATGESLERRGADPLAELTPQELRIGLRVAAGRTNPEVAGELFISRKTVERHLSQIYRKLGVRSRTELARVLSPLLPEHPASPEVSVSPERA